MRARPLRNRTNRVDPLKAAPLAAPSKKKLTMAAKIAVEHPAVAGPSRWRAVETGVIGRLTLVAGPRGLSAVHWTKPITMDPALESAPSTKTENDDDADDVAAAVSILDRAEKELREYFAGERKTFDVPLDMTADASSAGASEFRLSVWSRLREIPYGVTKSYSDVAREVMAKAAVGVNGEVGVGKAGLAVRAVGNANGRNPIPIFVPCHRVVRSSGALGGFGGGLDVKRKLLKLEGWKGEGDRWIV
ncbi:hypothetical protein HK101_008471 [Irineochytrium annulatum]|nr:hypothetical protein HK101_008471 [Irineochytrium annulatum]